MKNKIIRPLNFLLFILFILGIPLSYVLMQSFNFNLCYEHDLSCSYQLGFIGDLMFYISLVGVWITAGFLLFPQTVRSWFTFGWWATPLFLFIIHDVANPKSGGGFIAIFPSPSVQLPFYTALYLGASLGIIALSYILHRTKKQLPKFIKITLFILAAIAGAAIMWHLINPLIDGIELLMQQIFGR